MVADYGSGGALWEFVRRDFGVVEITSVAVGGATATANVLIAIPEEFNSVYNANYGGTARSYRWSEQLYSNRKGWPRYLNIYKQRLYLYDRFGFFYSVQSSYDDFTVGATPDLAGYELLGASTEMTADIKWATSGKVNIIGAGGEEFAVAASSSVQNGVSVSDLKIDHATSDGSVDVEPVRAKASVLHAGPDGRTLYEMAYNFQIDDFDSDEASLPSSHLLEPGIARLAWQRNPLAVIWMRMEDGGLVGLHL